MSTSCKQCRVGEKSDVEGSAKCTKCDVIDKVLQNGSGNLDMRIIMNGTDFEDGEIIINEKGEIVE